MSVRRPAPLVAQHEALAVGALADRLPGATRLSQVLAAGVKHLAKHKTVDTEAPKRDLLGKEIGFRTTETNIALSLLLKDLKGAVRAWMDAAGNSTALQNAQAAVNNVLNSISQRVNSVDDMEILRRQGFYFVLNWFYQNGTPQQSSDAQLVLGIALHDEHDREFPNILNNLSLGATMLGLADGPALALAHPDRGGVILNGPGPSNYTEARKAEKRQKVKDEREAALAKRQQDKQDGNISEVLEAQQNAEGMQEGEIVPGQAEDQVANQQADAQQAEQAAIDSLNDDFGYEDKEEPQDDEEDNFETQARR